MNRYGYIRVGAAVPHVSIADTETNTKRIIALAEKANEQGVKLLVFPELCITAYTCADLFMQQELQQKALEGLKQVALASASWPDMAVAVGLPVRYGNALFNCAAIVSGGKTNGIVPKTCIPNYSEFYEKRWFTSAASLRSGLTVNINGHEVPFGTDLLFDIDGVLTGVEICEDLWAPLPPSTFACLGGAKLIANLSASNELAAKHDYLQSLISSRSASLIAGYVYASAGVGESTTDVVYAGNAIVSENGTQMTHAQRFTAEEMLEYADVDAESLEHDRMLHVSYADNATAAPIPNYRIVRTSARTGADEDLRLKRHITTDPFVPANPYRRKKRCEEIIDIQAEGLMQRLRATGMKSITVGVSGGLDSTLAILVAATAFKRLGLPSANIIGVTMPGFGTTGRTYDNAVELIELLGATFLEISIKNAVTLHFEDIGHDISVHDLTYENSQARERTQILMDVSGQHHGMVLGTGDLSELALGWCTYNGDHMSMYGVNTSVPKTLVRHLVAWFAETADDKELARVLRDIIDTPVSPELIPATADGRISQRTEDLVGPYSLHDFFLYNTLRRGFRPRKVYMLACIAFSGTYTPAFIKHWLKEFYHRFFTQQFKRSCMPDGPKVGSICLSPRGDWRMPSDASPALWLKECDELPE